MTTMTPAGRHRPCSVCGPERGRRRSAAVGLTVLGVLTCVLLTWAPRIWAHEELETQIAAITREIEADPGNPRLYMARGELHRLHQEWSAAETDYAAALTIDPALLEVQLCRARMDLDRGRPGPAHALAGAVLQQRPHHLQALAIAARAAEQLGHPEQAVDLLDDLVAQDPRPSPDVYVWRSRLLGAPLDGTPSPVVHGDLPRALAGLNEAYARLGPVISIELAALRIEVELRRFDDALARLDRLARTVPLPALLASRRGEILERAGRTSEARTAYEAAIDALESLPPRRRTTPRMQEIERSVRSALTRL